MDETPISNPFDEEEKSGVNSIIWVALGIAAMCCGVLFVAALFYFKPNAQSLIAQYFPSSTPTASRTPPATATPIPTATNTPTATPNITATVQVQNAQSTAESAATNWQLVLSDPFDSNKNKWLVKENEDSEYANITYEIADGIYKWDVTAHKSVISWIRANQKSYTDFHLSVDVQQPEGPNTADYGVVFREDDNSNFYYFAVNDDGQYAIYLLFGEWETLTDWTQIDLFNPDEPNRLTVIGEGSHFTFFINGHYLTEITNDKIAKGYVALGVEMVDEDDHGIFTFDNFELRTP